MKLLQIALSLLLVLSPIACASVHKTTPDAISNIKYGMEFSEVQKTLGSEGDLVLRWAEKGKHYFVIRYSFGNPHRGYSMFYMIFRDDIYTAFIEEYNFYKAFRKHIKTPVGKLPFENGFEPLYKELVAQKDNFYKIDFHEVAKRGGGMNEYIPTDTDISGMFEATYYSPFWVPFLVVFSPFIYYAVKEDKKFQNEIDNLLIGTSKEAVIKLLGKPELSRKSVESDYEILFYRFYNAVGLRGGKIEWTFKAGIDDYQLYPQLFESE
jgi:hypothetical protein